VLSAAGVRRPLALRRWGLCLLRVFPPLARGRVPAGLSGARLLPSRPLAEHPDPLRAPEAVPL